MRAPMGLIKDRHGTYNKQLGAVQAMIGWGFRHGLVPDEMPETDPFKNIRVEGARSTCDAFDAHGLQAVFGAPLFTDHEIPEGGKGPTAVWLPLLAVFMGGRQNEFASHPDAPQGSSGFARAVSADARGADAVRAVRQVAFLDL